MSVFRDRLDFPQQCVAGIDGRDSYGGAEDRQGERGTQEDTVTAAVIENVSEPEVRAHISMLLANGKMSGPTENARDTRT